MSKNHILTFLVKGKKLAIETIKWGFAGGLLYYLVESGRLSFKDLKTFLSSPLIGLSAFVVLFLIVLIAVARWRLLLKTIGVEISYKIAFQLTTLGLFFFDNSSWWFCWWRSR